MSILEERAVRHRAHSVAYFPPFRRSAQRFFIASEIALRPAAESRFLFRPRAAAAGAPDFCPARRAAQRAFIISEILLLPAALSLPLRPRGFDGVVVDAAFTAPPPPNRC